MAGGSPARSNPEQARRLPYEDYVYTIGEFSKITGLTVKTLRFYHEKALLVPAYVADRTGYRHYDVPLRVALAQGPVRRDRPFVRQGVAYVKEKGYEIIMPTREIYIKGPGMIFKGNPKKYLTEIQMLVKE